MKIDDVRFSSKNPYIVLGVSKDASKVDIKKQYHTLCKEYHPDKNPDNLEKATEIFQAINTAYTAIDTGTYQESTPSSEAWDNIFQWFNFFQQNGFSQHQAPPPPPAPPKTQAPFEELIQLGFNEDELLKSPSEKTELLSRQIYTIKRFINSKIFTPDDFLKIPTEKLKLLLTPTSIAEFSTLTSKGFMVSNLVQAPTERLAFLLKNSVNIINLKNNFFTENDFLQAPMNKLELLISNNFNVFTLKSRGFTPDDLLKIELEKLELLLQTALYGIQKLTLMGFTPKQLIKIPTNKLKSFMEFSYQNNMHALLTIGFTTNDLIKLSKKQEFFLLESPLFHTLSGFAFFILNKIVKLKYSQLFFGTVIIAELNPTKRLLALIGLTGTLPLLFASSLIMLTFQKIQKIIALKTVTNYKNNSDKNILPASLQEKEAFISGYQSGRSALSYFESFKKYSCYRHPIAYYAGMTAFENKEKECYKKMKTL